MRERPILFSGPMVRAILAGRKTQTRRVVKGFHWITDTAEGVAPYWRYKDKHGSGPIVDGTIEWWMREHAVHGEPGDRLWVKETFCNIARPGYDPVYFYRADGDEKPDWVEHWKPSIFCTRKASRITMEIESIRIERLNDISGMDAWCEGCPYHPKAYPSPDDVKAWYRDLWESINGPESWAANPWVWVIEFKRVEVAP